MSGNGGKSVKNLASAIAVPVSIVSLVLILGCSTTPQAVPVLRDSNTFATAALSEMSVGFKRQLPPELAESRKELRMGLDYAKAVLAGEIYEEYEDRYIVWGGDPTADVADLQFKLDLIDEYQQSGATLESAPHYTSWITASMSPLVRYTETGDFSINLRAARAIGVDLWQFEVLGYTREQIQRMDEQS